MCFAVRVPFLVDFLFAKACCSFNACPCVYYSRGSLCRRMQCVTVYQLQCAMPMCTHAYTPPLFILSSLMQEHVSWHVEHFHGALLLGDLSMSWCLFHQKFLGKYREPALFGDRSWLLWCEWIEGVWNSAAITECFVKRSLNCSSFATF